MSIVNRCQLDEICSLFVFIPKSERRFTFTSNQPRKKIVFEKEGPEAHDAGEVEALSGASSGPGELLRAREGSAFSTEQATILNQGSRGVIFSSRIRSISNPSNMFHLALGGLRGRIGLIGLYAAKQKKTLSLLLLRPDS